MNCKSFIHVIIFLFSLSLGITFNSCEDPFEEKTEETDDGDQTDDENDDDDDNNNQGTQVTDVFVYFKNSVFTYVIKDGTNSVKTTKMTWTVTDYDSDNDKAKIKCELDPSDTQIPLPQNFYLRKSETGILEYSEYGSSWKSLTLEGSDVNFLFGTKAADPSSLLGSVKNGVDPASVSYPDGSSSGYKVYSEYDASSRDNYFYTDYTREYYCQTVGFVKSISFVSDLSSYPAWTYKREVDMVSYKIIKPGGTTIEGGEQKPEAPSNLTASYKKNVSSYNSSTGMYEKRTYVTLTWKDNSSNETHFNIYMKATDNNWYPISDLVMYEGGPSFYPETFPSNKVSGSIRAGYYVNWSPGTYYFKISAASLDMESDMSNEATITAY